MGDPTSFGAPAWSTEHVHRPWQADKVPAAEPMPPAVHVSRPLSLSIAAAAADRRPKTVPSMNVAQLKRFCARLPGATAIDYGEPYNFLVYSVAGRKFAYFKTSEPERWRFSVRVTPDRFIELTDMPGVKPARYRGRYGWITIVDVSAFPPSYLTELVQCSHERASVPARGRRRGAARGS